MEKCSQDLCSCLEKVLTGSVFVVGDLCSCVDSVDTICVNVWKKKCVDRI